MNIEAIREAAEAKAANQDAHPGIVSSPVMLDPVIALELCRLAEIGLADHVAYMKRVHEEIAAHMNEDGAHFEIGQFVPADKVRGQRDEYDGFFDHVYVDQNSGYAPDTYCGTVYFPVGGEYIAVSFSM